MSEESAICADGCAQKYWYIIVAGQPGQVYVDTVASVGSALVLAQPGDPVTITVLDVGAENQPRPCSPSPTPAFPCMPRVRNRGGWRARAAAAYSRRN